MINHSVRRALETQVLAAVLQLGDDAYGVTIAYAIETERRRAVPIAMIYLTLDRLEDDGLVTSRRGESTPERGGRAKKYFHITDDGVRAVRQEERAIRRQGDADPFGVKAARWLQRLNVIRA